MDMTTSYEDVRAILKAKNYGPVAAASSPELDAEVWAPPHGWKPGRAVLILKNPLDYRCCAVAIERAGNAAEILKTLPKATPSE